MTSYLDDNQHILFDMGYNPDYVIEESNRLVSVIGKIAGAGGIAGSEQIICTEINKNLKTPVTRGSVNLPFAVFPFALAIAAYTANPGDVFLASAAQGGAASAIAAIAAAITCARNNDCLPAPLEEGLINKKKIFSMTADIAAGRNRHGIINELAAAEPSLTNKENEEFLARNRKSEKSKPRGPEKKRGKPEDVLSKHVVESWTKIDKAKWKKEKSRNNEDQEP